MSRGVAVVALGYLKQLFASGPDAAGTMMAGRAEVGVGETETVARQVSVLAAEVVELPAAPITDGTGSRSTASFCRASDA